MPFSYSRLVDFYQVSMELTGFSAALEKYVRRLPLELPAEARILDAGCGTGILGMAMKKSLPKSTVLATDIEAKFFPILKKQIAAYRYPPGEFQIGISDINTPEQVRLLSDQSTLVLAPASFDAVLVGGVLGYAVNPRDSVERLLKLVKVGGYFVDIEMSESVVGNMIGMFYKYQNQDRKAIASTLKKKGWKVQLRPFTLADFPAGMTRSGLIARRLS